VTPVAPAASFINQKEDPMLNVQIRRPYSGESCDCVVETVPDDAGVVLQTADDDWMSAGNWNVDLWEASTTRYHISGGKAGWRKFWSLFRKMCRSMGVHFQIVDYASHLTGPESFPFPDSRYPEEAA
jgi:hypothetical protein